MCSRAWANICGSIFLFFCFDAYASTVTLTHVWVTTDNVTWGLWRQCDRNRTNQEDDDNTGCQVIHPGDSPGYFEGVRAMAVVTLILNFIFMVVLMVSFTSSTLRTITSFFYFSSAATTLAVLGVKFKTDDRWKDSNPVLGFGFWMACGCAGFNVLLFVVMTASTDDSQTSSRRCSFGRKRRGPCCCVSVSDPVLPTMTRRASNASCLTIDTGNKVTVFHAHPLDPFSPSGVQANPVSLSNNPPVFANGPSDPANNPRDVWTSSRDFSNNPRHLSSYPHGGLWNSPRDPSNNPRDLLNNPRDLSNSPRDPSNNPRYPSNNPRDLLNDPRDLSNLSNSPRDPPRENPDGRESTSLAHLQFPVLSLPRVSLSSEQDAERRRTK